VHGEVADLVLGEPALADAPRGDGGGTEKPMTINRLVVSVTTVSARLVSPAAAV
jgi:hypothetical protein